MRRGRQGRPRPAAHGYGPSTYSIVGADPAAGESGVAVQSKFLAVGAFVPWATGGVGAVATQAYANIAYGRRGLALLEGGTSPQVAIDELIASDEMGQHRQLGIVAADGSSASFTGSECFEFAGSVTGHNFAAQGNILSSPDVPAAMGDAFTNTKGSLAERLMSALTAGEAAGGEKRGMESAALLVVKPDGGYGGNHDRFLDLRVDHAVDPIEDLRGLLDLHTLYFRKSLEADLLDFDGDLQDEVTGLLRVIDWWEEGEDLEGNLFSWVGWHNLEERWLGVERLDPLVLRELRAAGKGEA